MSLAIYTQPNSIQAREFLFPVGDVRKVRIRFWTKSEYAAIPASARPEPCYEAGADCVFVIQPAPPAGRFGALELGGV